jgi:hypothetical protein
MSEKPLAFGPEIWQSRGNPPFLGYAARILGVGISRGFDKDVVAALISIS